MRYALLVVLMATASLLAGCIVPVGRGFHPDRPDFYHHGFGPRGY